MAHPSRQRFALPQYDVVFVAKPKSPFRPHPEEDRQVRLEGWGRIFAAAEFPNFSIVAKKRETLPSEPAHAFQDDRVETGTAGFHMGS